MRNKLVELVEAKAIKNDLPNLKIGQNVKVHVRIREGNKERIQVFEGLVMALKNTGANKSMVVRKISYGVGVERIFMLNSPLISHIDILRTNKVRRSKLYYMRERAGKSARLKEIRTDKKK